MAIKKGGSSSVVEHQLPKLRVAGSTPVSRAEESVGQFVNDQLTLFFWDTYYFGISYFK